MVNGYWSSNHPKNVALEIFLILCIWIAYICTWKSSSCFSRTNATNALGDKDRNKAFIKYQLWGRHGEGPLQIIYGQWILSQKAWTRNPALPFTSCAAMVIPLNFPVPQFPQTENTYQLLNNKCVSFSQKQWVRKCYTYFIKKDMEVQG